LVYHQLTNPNPQACTLAEIDSFRGRKSKGPIKVDITEDNLADGLGMPRELFHQVRSGIKEKIAHHMTLQPHEQAHHTAVMALERLFEVHVPRLIEPIVVRRIFTMKARADYKKIINGWTDPGTGVHLSFEQISDLLRTVGAKPPVMDANQTTLACFGILWEANNNACRNCDLFASCNAEAATLGLAIPMTSTTASVLDKGGFNLSPKLLPAVAKVRTAHKTDESARPQLSTKTDKPVTSSLAEEEMVNYLEKNFWGFNCFIYKYYTHRGDTSMNKGTSYLFWLGRLLDGKRTKRTEDGGQLRLAFIPPNKPEVKEPQEGESLPPPPPYPPAWWLEMRSKLEKIGGSYYLPLNCEYSTLVELCEKQAQCRPSHVESRPPRPKKPKKAKSLCPKPPSST
jgi:hypothetical protein